MLRTLCVAAMVASYAPRRRPAVARPVCAHQRRSLLRYATDAETDEDVQHIITCGSCKAVYAIDKDILGKGAGAKVQCEVCGNVWFQATARVNTCVEIKSLRRVRAESSRRPPRHRREAGTRRSG
jgi:predicted Zn finger-like uncharacterized protein